MSFSKRNRLEKPSLPGERHLAIGAHRFLDDGVCTMRVEEWAPGDVKEQGSKKAGGLEQRFLISITALPRMGTARVADVISIV